MLTEALATIAAKQIANQIAGQAGLGAKAVAIVRGTPTERAIAKALVVAWGETAAKIPDIQAGLFDEDFLQREGAALLARAVTRTGDVDPAELTSAWADALGLKGEPRIAATGRLHPVAARFLERFRLALAEDPDLQRLADARALASMSRRLDDVADALRASPPTPSTEDAYLRWVRGVTGSIDLRGIAQSALQAHIHLPDVYVPLRLQPIRAPQPGEREPMLLPAVSESYSYHWHLRELTEEQEEVGVLLDDVLPGRRAAIVLGDPGSGKSTMLRMAAWRAATLRLTGEPAALPILVRLAAYADTEAYLRQPLSDFLMDYASLREFKDPAGPQLLRAALDAGSALVLLDGLDEVTDRDARQKVAYCVDDFVRAATAAGNTVVVSSRSAGYADAPLSHELPLYEIRGLSEPAVTDFLAGWCPTFEKALAPDGDTAARARRADDEQAALLHAIKTIPSVRRLSTNPFLLTVLAVVHRSSARLPSQRAVLYRVVTETLLDTWRASQGVATHLHRDQRRAVRVLGDLAFHLHVTTGIGRIPRSTAVDIIARALDPSHDADDPAEPVVQDADALLRAIAVHTGIFLERGLHQYGFIHLAFEEYFAAQRITRRRAAVETNVRALLHDPRWSEPILLALGSLAEEHVEDVEDLVDDVLLASSGSWAPAEHEALLGRDRLFALRCLTDDVPMSDATITGLMAFSAACVGRSGPGRFESFRTQLMVLLMSLTDRDLRERLLRALLDVMPEMPRPAFVEVARLARQHQFAEPALFHMMMNRLDELEGDHDEQIDLRYGIGAAVTRRHPEQVVSYLYHPSAPTRFLAAWMLAATRAGHTSDSRVLDVIVDTLRAGDDALMDIAGVACSQFADAHGELPDQVLQALVHAPSYRPAFYEEEDERAAEHLLDHDESLASTLAQLTADRTDILRLGKRSDDARVRRRTEIALGMVALETNDSALLLEVLASTDSSVVESVVSQFQFLEPVTDEQLAVLREHERWLRAPSAAPEVLRILAVLEPSLPGLLQAWTAGQSEARPLDLEWRFTGLLDDAQLGPVLDAAEPFSRLRPGEQTVLALVSRGSSAHRARHVELLALLARDPTSPSRRWAGRMLGHDGSADHAATFELLLADSATAPKVLDGFIESGRVPRDVLPTVERLVDAASPSTRARATVICAGLGAGRPDLVPSLVDVLDEQDEDVRTAAIVLLGRTSTDPAIVKILKEVFDVGELSFAAGNALAEMARANPDLRADVERFLLDRLADDEIAPALLSSAWEALHTLCAVRAAPETVR